MEETELSEIFHAALSTNDNPVGGGGGSGAAVTTVSPGVINNNNYVVNQPNNPMMIHPTPTNSGGMNWSSPVQPMQWTQQQQQPPPPSPFVLNLAPSSSSSSSSSLPVQVFSDTKRMKAYEIGYVLKAQIKATKTDDPFTDDYYCFQLAEKKQKERELLYRLAAVGVFPSDSSSESLGDLLNSVVTSDLRPAAFLKELVNLKQGKSTPGLIALAASRKRGPLPELPQQGKISNSFTGSGNGVQVLEKGSYLYRLQERRKYELSHSSLGRSQTSSMRRPHELLSFAPLSEEDRKDASKTFSSDVWKLRGLSTEASDLMLQIDDVQRILLAKAQAIPQNSQEPEWNFANESLQRLQDTQVLLCANLAKILGIIDTDEVAKIKEKAASNGETFQDDQTVVRLLGLLWLPKGRRMLIKAVPYLLVEHHLTLLQRVAQYLVYFVCTSPDGMTSQESGELEKAKLDDLCARVFGREFAAQSFAETTHCLSLLLQTQSSESLRAILATPGGAELIRALLMHGQGFVDTCTDENARKEWSDLFDTFVDVAEKGIKDKEESLTTTNST